MDELQVVESIMEHEYFIAVYGVILFYGAILLYAIRKFKPVKGVGGKMTKFSFKAWRIENTAGFITTLVFAPLVIIMDDEMLDIYNWKYPDQVPAEKLGDIVYLLAGPLATSITMFVSWLRSWNINKIKARLRKALS